MPPPSPQFAAGAEQELGAPSCSPRSETAAHTPRGWDGPKTEGSCWWRLGGRIKWAECRWGSHMQFLHAAIDCRCTSSWRALRSLGSCVLRVQNIRYRHSPVQLYMLAFTEDMRSCFLLQTQPGQRGNNPQSPAGAHTPDQPASLGWG